MRTCGLDELAEALNMTVHESHERINRRYAEHPGNTIESVTVSIELNCTVRKKHQKKGGSQATLTARLAGWADPPRKGTHRLTLCSSSQQDKVLTSFDGKTATDFTAEHLSPAHKQNQKRCNYFVVVIGLFILCLIVALVYVICSHL